MILDLQRMNELRNNGNIKVDVLHKDKKTYVKINYSDQSTIKTFLDIPILNRLRGTVFLQNGSKIVSIYTGLNKFWNQFQLAKLYPEYNNINIVTALEKLDGMYILPYVIDDRAYLSSRWSFSSDIVDRAYDFLTKEYRDFILECYKKKIYLSFELICKESRIKVIYPKERYGLYLIAVQDEYGRSYPLTEHNGKHYITRITTEIIEVPSDIKCCHTYSFTSDFSKLTEFVNSMSGFDFEGVVAYISPILKLGKIEGCNYDNVLEPIKLKNINYFELDHSNKLFKLKLADAIFHNTDLEERFKLVEEYETIKDIYHSFMEDIDAAIMLAKKFTTKKEAGLYIKEHNLPPYYHIIFHVIEGKDERHLKSIKFNLFLKRLKDCNIL